MSMTYVVWLDDRGGISFGGRRLSRDRVLTARLNERLAGVARLCSPYTGRVYGTADTTLTEDPACRVEGAAYLVETFDPTPYLRAGDCLLVYRFGRTYPFDCRLTLDLAALTPVSRTELVGHSHPSLVEELYVLPLT